ncbi:MAG TPA: MFS transporter [Terriglobia bacterium]|nr:MFS transporter [Terriglobia bacterium]
MKTVDVGQVLDEGRWSGYQKLLILGTALTIILDGIDNQLLGNAVPSLMRDWSLPRGAFTTVLALGPLGMMFGGALGGMLGDRIGRRTALLSSVLAFAALTLAIATVNGVMLLGILRFLAGLGLGGAMPNAAALASEYVPRRQRPFAVTLTIVCIPLGGTLAALLSAQILPLYGWRALFLVGGIIPILLALVLFKVLPESPRFLASRRERWPELIAMLRKLGHNVSKDVAFVEAGAGQKGKSKASMRDLFVPNFRRDTIGLFGSFFFCLLVNYVGILLIPVVLTGAGFAQPFPNNALAVWNFGGVGGAIIGALVIQRLGSRITMLSMSAISIIVAFAMAAMPFDPQSTFGVVVMFVVLGGLLNAVQTTMYALAANVYPTEIRGTGIGAAVAVGRIGNVLASYVGNFALDSGGAPAYFSTFGIGMIVVFASLALVRRHIDRTTGAPVAAKVGAPAGH